MIYECMHITMIGGKGNYWDWWLRQEHKYLSAYTKCMENWSISVYVSLGLHLRYKFPHWVPWYSKFTESDRSWFLFESILFRGQKQRFLIFFEPNSSNHLSLIIVPVGLPLLCSHIEPIRSCSCFQDAWYSSPNCKRKAILTTYLINLMDISCAVQVPFLSLGFLWSSRKFCDYFHWEWWSICGWPLILQSPP